MQCLSKDSSSLQMTLAYIAASILHKPNTLLKITTVLFKINKRTILAGTIRASFVIQMRLTTFKGVEYCKQGTVYIPSTQSPCLKNALFFSINCTSALWVFCIFIIIWTLLWKIVEFKEWGDSFTLRV